MAFIEGWPHLRGGLYEGFHCMYIRTLTFMAHIQMGMASLLLLTVSVTTEDSRMVEGVRAN